MTNHLRCPVCASENVYCRLSTFHCKRCGNIWKARKKKNHDTDICRFLAPVSPGLRTWEKTKSLEERMEEKLQEYLKRSKGKFNLDQESRKIGDISMALFRKYIRICVKNGTLTKTKDRNGIVWYSRAE
jgi:Fic family protein